MISLLENFNHKHTTFNSLAYPKVCADEADTKMGSCYVLRWGGSPFFLDRLIEAPPSSLVGIFSLQITFRV